MLGLDLLIYSSNVDYAANAMDTPYDLLETTSTCIIDAQYKEKFTILGQWGEINTTQTESKILTHCNLISGDLWVMAFLLTAFFDRHNVLDFLPSQYCLFILPPRVAHLYYIG